jgi:hypothetical protein
MNECVSDSVRLELERVSDRVRKTVIEGVCELRATKYYASQPTSLVSNESPLCSPPENFLELVQQFQHLTPNTYGNEDIHIVKNM